MPRKKKVTGEVSRRSAHSSLQTINKEKPQQRNAANARERARMRVLSRAFYRLKTALSWVPPDTKLSKLDTLRMAAQHISHMKRILESDDPFSQNDYYPPMTMTWPFAFGEGNPNGSGLGAGTESEDGEDECGMVDDGESLSCVSGSSWEEVRTAEIPMTSMTHQRVKDRSHLDQDNKSNPFNNTLHHHQHLTHHSFQQNVVSFS